MPERRRLTGGLAASLIVCCGGVALAQGGPELALSADTSQVGYIGLMVRGKPGATVTLSENLGESDVR